MSRFLRFLAVLNLRPAAGSGSAHRATFLSDVTPRHVNGCRL